MVSKKELEDLERRAREAVLRGEGVVVVPEEVVFVREDKAKSRIGKKS